MKTCFSKGSSQQRNRNNKKERKILELKYIISKIFLKIHAMNLIGKWT